METMYMDRELQKWLIIYIWGHDKIRFQDFPGLPDKFRAMARKQDDIDWRSFMEGRISK